MVPATMTVMSAARAICTRRHGFIGASSQPPEGCGGHQIGHSGGTSTSSEDQPPMHPRVLDPDARSFRVGRTFAFLDLCGFTDFVDAHGDDDAVDELRTLRATVREIAPLCGVRVDKWLGDGV